MNWHYLEDRQQRGPVSEEQFTRLVQQGVIRADTLIWCQGMEKWQRYDELVPAASNATPVAAAADAATTGGGLHIQHSATDAPSATREAGCSQCGAVVPVSQLVNFGSAQLCPQCQTARARMMATGWGSGPVEYANPWKRLWVYLCDSVFCWLMIWLVAIVLVFCAAFLVRGSAQLGWLVRIAQFGPLALLFYYFVLRVADGGQTTFMRRYHIRLVSAQGQPVGLWRVLGRFIVLYLIVILTLGLANIVVFFGKSKRCLQDMIFGTIVIKS